MHPEASEHCSHLSILITWGLQASRPFHGSHMRFLLDFFVRLVPVYCEPATSWGRTCQTASSAANMWVKSPWKPRQKPDLGSFSIYRIHLSISISISISLPNDLSISSYLYLFKCRSTASSLGILGSKLGALAVKRSC